jgi:hypothetical protein
VALARALVVTMMVALTGYLVLSPETEPGGVILMAAWPMAILGWTFVHVRATNPQVVGLIARLAAGVALSALPLVLHHVANGSLVVWFSDIVLSAAGETQMDFFGRGWYGVLPLAAFYQTMTASSPVQFVNGLYWMALPSLSLVNGVLVLRQLRSGEDVRDLVLPVLASFYALVSLYFEGPLYLYYSVGLSLVSVLWLRGAGSRVRRATWSTAAAALAIIAVAFHAGQSRHRTSRQILEGVRVSNTWSEDHGGLNRARLRLDRADRETYGRLIDLILANVPADESILALPNDAELYFLANRRNVSRFYNSALGLRTGKDSDALLRAIEADPPRLVFFRPDDKYNTDRSRHIVDRIRSTHTLEGTIGGLEVYHRKHF